MVAKNKRMSGRMDKGNAIEVRGLGKRVADAGGTLAILDGIDFTVRAGTAVAITGSSGSGKSTLLGLLAGLDVPSAGSVMLAGRDLFALDEDGRARLRANHVGFVFQSFQLLPNLTALENVMLPLELAGQPARAAARGMLERVGLGDRLHHYPRTLSGGEQQRVSLARAFVVKPDLLFADEPTGSLDAATGERVIDLIFELHREHGATLVLVTHDPGLAARCERQLVLAAGKLVSGD
jgi:putative ABC transport system ATP-binding protein